MLRVILPIASKSFPNSDSTLSHLMTRKFEHFENQEIVHRSLTQGVTKKAGLFPSMALATNMGTESYGSMRGSWLRDFLTNEPWR